MDKEILDRTVKESVRLCQENERPLNFRNIVICASLAAINEESLPKFVDERELYRHVVETDGNFGIRLYVSQIERRLLVEPGYPIKPLPSFREEVARVIIEHLPETDRTIKESAGPASFYRLDQCERGIVGALVIDEQPSVLKLTNSKRETEIARHLGEKGLAPRVIEADEFVILEEFISDLPITRFASRPAFLGRRAGWLLRSIHDEGIVYDNRFLDHIRVRRFPLRTRIIDLEGAKWSRSSDDIQTDWNRLGDEIAKFYPDNQRSNQAFHFL